MVDRRVLVSGALRGTDLCLTMLTIQAGRGWRGEVQPGGAEEGRGDAGPLFLRGGRMGTALAGSAWAGTGHAVSMEMPGGKGRVTVCLHCAAHEG